MTSRQPCRIKNQKTTCTWEGKMLKHKRSALSIALAVAMAPTWAAAQTATPAQASDAQQGASEQTAGAVTDLDKVQVTGLRRAIEGAISVKRDSTSIVEAISAEDIGRLPDVSIAESLARLPG
ncbi:TonB-dependent receptor, partial [Xanthomonas perforans]